VVAILKEVPMGHKEIDVRQVIPAPPAAVFASLLDRSSWPAWSGHDAFELVRPGAAGPYDVGSVGLLRSGRRRVMREEIVEVVADRRIGYTLLAGLPLRRYRADFDLTPVGDGTEVRWHSSFDAPPGSGWIYVAALRRFTRRMLEGLEGRLVTARPGRVGSDLRPAELQDGPHLH
jgi:uncharacterized protein YndB with AHSA1/START domain